MAFIGLQQKPNGRYFFEEKIYWSGWSIQKNINFRNTTTGTYLRVANWKDVLTFQFNTRLITTEKIALLGGLIYETNPINSSTNQVGYPLSADITFSGGGFSYRDGILGTIDVLLFYLCTKCTNKSWQHGWYYVGQYSRRDFAIDL